MLERLLEFRVVLNALSSSVYEFRDESGNKLLEKIESLDFDKIETLVAALKPISELTTQLSLRDASVADILPIYRMFTRQWPADELNENDESKQIRQTITKGLDKRMEKMKTDKYAKVANNQLLF